MELEADDMRVLGAIQRGASSVRFLKGIVNLKKDELEKTLDVLDESHLISSSYVSGLLGQKKLVIQITEDGTKKLMRLSLTWRKNGEKCWRWLWLVREQPWMHLFKNALIWSI